MDHPVIHFATVFTAFFAIMNPIANATLFVGMTQGLEARMRRQIALRSVCMAFLIVAVFAVGGREIFKIFGITLPAFRIAGGLMIGLIGYHMLQGEHSSIHAPSEGGNDNDAVLGMAITPLGIPVLAGPGTIATAMNFAANTAFSGIVIILAALGAMCALTFIAFLSGQWLGRILGKEGVKVISRLMGLILSVIGVQMLITGIRGAFGV